MEANYVDALGEAELPSPLDAVPAAQREIHDGDMLVVKIERAFGEMLHVSLTSGSQTFTGILFSNANGYVRPPYRLLPTTFSSCYILPNICGCRSCPAG